MAGRPNPRATRRAPAAPSPRRRAALAVACLALATAACRDGAEFDWRPAPDTRAALAPADVERFDALLRDVFGTALAPAPRTPPQLAAQGVDLAAPDFGRTSAALAAAVRQDNARRYGDVLDRIAAGADPDLPDELARDPALRALDAGSALADAVLDARPALADTARLYARQCLSCHGREGGGDGPMRAQLRPPPRDFRAGSEFQRFRVDLSERPTQDELVAVIHGGIPGTGMPSFRTYTSAQLARLADLVRLLALRGEVERRLVADVAAGRAIDRARALEHLAAAAEPWLSSRAASAAGDDSQGRAVAPRAERTADSAAEGAGRAPSGDAVAGRTP